MLQTVVTPGSSTVNANVALDELLGSFGRDVIETLGATVSTVHDRLTVLETLPHSSVARIEIW
jgi:hypothetical protein